MADKIAVKTDFHNMTLMEFLEYISVVKKIYGRDVAEKCLTSNMPTCYFMGKIVFSQVPKKGEK